jgi:hypothetical protein
MILPQCSTLHMQGLLGHLSLFSITSSNANVPPSMSPNNRAARSSCSLLNVKDRSWRRLAARLSSCDAGGRSGHLPNGWGPTATWGSPIATAPRPAVLLQRTPGGTVTYSPSACHRVDVCSLATVACAAWTASNKNRARDSCSRLGIAGPRLLVMGHKRIHFIKLAVWLPGQEKQRTRMARPWCRHTLQKVRVSYPGTIKPVRASYPGTIITTTHYSYHNHTQSRPRHIVMQPPH